MKLILLLEAILSEYILGFAVIFGACQTLDKIFRYQIKKYVLFSLTVPLIHAVTIIPGLITGAGINSELMIIVYTAMMWLILTDRKFKSLAACIASVFFSFTAAYGITYSLSSVFTNVFFNEDLNIYFGILIGLAAHLITIVFIVLFIGFIGKNKVSEPLSVWNMFVIAFVSGFSNSIMMNSVMNDEIAYTGIYLGVIAISSAVVISVKNSEKNFYSRISRVNENYLNAQKEYYDSRQSSETEIRRLKHDMKNHLICIRELSLKKKYRELENYISALSEVLEETDKSLHTGNDIADAIVNDKLSKADSENITLTVSGTIENLEIAPIDMCTVISNLLDNAIEAEEKLPEEKRRIELSFKQNLHFILITVTNPTLHMVKTDETLKSDKKSHGFGISNIRKAVEKYGGEVSFSCEQEEVDYMFCAEIIFPKVSIA